jgi:hypothetical protein
MMTMQLDPIDSTQFPTPPPLAQDDHVADDDDHHDGCCTVSCPEDETELGEFLLDAVDWLQHTDETNE